MFTRKRHAHDDALVRWYMADRGLEALESRDEAVVSHLGHCERCAARYEQLCLDLDGAADGVAQLADAAFSAEMLLQQRERIMRRIDSQSARVIAFPAHETATRGVGGLRGGWRWVAAAAAAGLLVGVAAGRMWQMGGDDPQPIYATRTIGPTTGGNGQVRPARLVVSDDSFLSEVDSALAAPQTPELQAIDAMTLSIHTGPPIR